MADSILLSFNGEKPGLKQISVVVQNILIRYRLSMSSVLLFGVKLVFKKKRQRKHSTASEKSQVKQAVILF